MAGALELASVAGAFTLAGVGLSGGVAYFVARITMTSEADRAEAARREARHLAGRDERKSIYVSATFASDELVLALTALAAARVVLDERVALVGSDAPGLAIDVRSTYDLAHARVMTAYEEWSRRTSELSLMAPLSVTSSAQAVMDYLSPALVQAATGTPPDTADVARYVGAWKIEMRRDLATDED